MGYPHDDSAVSIIQKVPEVGKMGRKSLPTIPICANILQHHMPGIRGDELLVFGVVVLFMLATPKIYQGIEMLS